MDRADLDALVDRNKLHEGAQKEHSGAIGR